MTQVSDKRSIAIAAVETRMLGAAQQIVDLEEVRGTLKNLIIAARNLEMHLIVGSVVHCGNVPCPSAGCKKSLPQFREALTKAEEILS